MFKNWTRAFNAVETAAWGGSKTAEAIIGDPSPTENDWHPGNAGGFASQTRVATPMGWREARLLSPGDMILTVDSDWQPVRQLHRSVLWPGKMQCPQALRPLHVPGGVFGNNCDMILLPEQGVMFESEISLELFGAYSVIVPAALLEGFFGIYRFVPKVELDVVSIVFDREELLVTETGAMVQCPRHGPANLMSLDELLDEARLDKGDPKAALPKLGADHARELLIRLTGEGRDTLGFRPDEFDGPQAAFA
ncbi:MAG: Hint domain-containing protein [Brevirhabdus sp.]